MLFLFLKRVVHRSKTEAQGALHFHNKRHLATSDLRVEILPVADRKDKSDISFSQNLNAILPYKRKFSLEAGCAVRRYDKLSIMGPLRHRQNGLDGKVLARFSCATHCVSCFGYLPRHVNRNMVTGIWFLFKREEFEFNVGGSSLRE